MKSDICRQFIRTSLDNNFVKFNGDKFEKTAFDNGIHMFRTNNYMGFQKHLIEYAILGS